MKGDERDKRKAAKNKEEAIEDGEHITNCPGSIGG